MDTIYALATARGKAGVSVVRMSGPAALAVLRQMVATVPEPRRASLRALHADDEVLDRALVIWFEAGKSFTGEDVVELHLHGSLAIVGAVLSYLGRLPGLRLAEAGEFTRRALFNGTLDLSQVEGLADLIASETEAQRRQAMRIFSGALGKRTESWRSRLIRACALIEAVIDFADEDVPVDVRPEVAGLVSEVISELKAEQAGYRTAERIRDGFEVAIIGAPNSGKSTLLNRLVGRDAAITSEFAGTTRDIIEVRMDLAGLPVTFLDTAGLRDTEDLVEAIGIDRAVQRAEAADLRVFLLDEAGPTGIVDPRPEDIVVIGKSDLRGENALGVSGLTGYGVDELLDRVAGVLRERCSDMATITRLRHQRAVEGAILALDSALVRLLTESGGEELTSDDLRTALSILDSLIGRVDVEDLLGEIFASFCIGK